MAPASMKISRQEQYERALRRSIRFLEDEVCFLRDCLWQETQGRHEIFDIPIQTPRKEEECGINGTEDTIKKMLEL